MRDLNLLRRAAQEFFAEGFAAPEAERALRGTDPELLEEARKSFMPPRSVPDGCFHWIHYLIWLEGVLEITDVPLTAEEVEALRTLKRERARFQAEHPACPHCGMPNESHALRCRECMGEIGK
ncbi:MAG: hypothetical protein ACYCSP_05920 [Acidobacteriaceae bacterium]